MRLLSVLFFIVNAFALHLPDGTNQYDSNVWASARVENIKGYEGGFGELFTFLQGNEYFAYGVVIAVLGVLIGFTLHFLVVGPKHFSHDGKKVYAFNIIERVMHGIAAVSWIVLVPTGIIMMWGSAFGGGTFVRLMKNSHGIATLFFAFSVIPLFLYWTKRMLPAIYDIKWMMIVGGYLSKKKACVPAGKFNAGQKAWYWIAIPGGMVMIATGAAMYFLDFKQPSVATWLGLSQIELLRLSAIIHNVLGVVCAVFFLVHIYMAAIAIHGAIWSMITGYKEEEEVYVLHHYWYQELISKDQIPVSEYEKVYPKLK
ncbi:formate dehydrogenase subunit gamma [Campylobacter pinnipediorum]|uniref:Formate dehydrogenase subunit gamma n=1 Tax=Campylobacter pinnipediorum subsp. pinnipediorum TaxID=1660067 RepID=A0AAX0LCP9_9BACT|nr:formate dehydrogenase subunit gamma [Campylobacter pinnipediorum]AQW81479.1 formate dehydrogenase N, cytochrome b-556 subunit [Campylobacter pinnipediorum subsp. pinnipediorum]AQW84674.1 formate dehydrogenase N, cytochrome b-556 subunit [Campylobacter pinnipediorum subsp. pinnipediorum]OPA81853.1 formate dehydrogenase subunit gamma [Campylobacter pinnipediorum subsp. pinnipediorum]